MIPQDSPLRCPICRGVHLNKSRCPRLPVENRETARMAKFKETAERIAAQNARRLIAGREEDDSD